MRKKLVLILLLAISNMSSQAYAQHLAGGGYGFEIPRLRPTSYTREPQVSFPLSGLTSEAQVHVNLAVESAHGFWIYEAERHLREAMSLHPRHPMLPAITAFVQTIFGSGDFARGSEYFRRASHLMRNSPYRLSPRERLWFLAIKALYDDTLSSSEARQTLHIARLEQLVRQSPEDLEVKSFLALANWLYRILPASNPADVQSLIMQTDHDIDQVLRANPKHPAHHYKIHLWNTGSDEHRALQSARLSGPAQSHIAHLWHMPAHIFYPTNHHYYALKHAEIAHRVDHAQLAARGLMPSNVHNYYHNYRDFALKLNADAGRIGDAAQRAAAMLRAGRLPHASSKYAHASLAQKLLKQLERYRLWQTVEAMIDEGYVSDLVTGDQIFDRQLSAELLRLQIRIGTSSPERYTQARGVVQKNMRDLERLYRDAVAGEDSAQLLHVLGDATAWVELAEQRERGQVHEEVIAALTKNGLTPAHEILVLAQTFGHSHRVAPLVSEMLSKMTALRVPEALDLLHALLNMPADSSLLERNIADLIRQVKEQVASVFLPPVDLSDFANLPLWQSHPQLVEGIIADAERRLEERRASTPEEYTYLEAVNLDSMGPRDPEILPMREFKGRSSEVVQAFATPAPGHFKLFVFAVGPSCSACLRQLEGLKALKEQFLSLGVDLHVITATGEDVPGLSTLGDRSLRLHRHFGVWDEFSADSLHAVVLIDERRDMIWHSVSEHAIEDTQFILAEVRRVTRLSKSEALP